MERTTTREGELLPGREAEALCRLSRLETMMEDVWPRRPGLSQQPQRPAPRGQDKNRPLPGAVGAKADPLRHDRRLRGCGALPMKEPAENSCNDLNGL